jgi:hypothetical protein
LLLFVNSSGTDIFANKTRQARQVD